MTDAPPFSSRGSAAAGGAKGLRREDRLKAENVELVLMNDLRCISLMEEFITARPELWNEDIGVPPKA